MTFGNTESMLPKLDEDPVDTQEVIPQYNDAVKNPKHQSLRFLGYFAAGFLVFVVVFLLTSLGILYYFHTDFKKFITNVKTDAYHMAYPEEVNPDVTPLPKKIIWVKYTNYQQNYTIMYPPDWILQQDTGESIILYPPESMNYARLTQADIGAGLGPRLFITVLTRPFVIPDPQSTKLTSSDGVTGYAYTGQTSDIPTVDFPIHNGTNILEFTLKNIGQDDIDMHLAQHNSKLVVKDIDMETFNKIVASLQFTK